MSTRVSSYRARKSYGPKITHLDPELKKIKEEDRERLKKCNDRLVNYIDKVSDLEEANKRLAAENAILRKKGKKPEKDIGSLYDEELRKLREKVEDLTVEEKKVELERDNLGYELDETKDKLEKETEERKDIEKEVKDLRKDVDDATIERASLESKIENLQEALHLERKAHEVELENLRSQIAPEHFSVLENEPTSMMPDLTDAIYNVRQQYEAFNSKTVESLDTYYKEKVEGHLKQLRCAQDENGELRKELADVKKTNSHLEADVDSLRVKCDNLERRMADTEDTLAKERIDSQEKIRELNEELQKAREDLCKYLRDYQDLTNLKLSLDQEIAIYNKLLQGGESKISDVEMADSPAARGRSGSRSSNRGKSKSRSRSRSRSSSNSSRSTSDIVEDLMEAEKEKAGQ